ncbi:MAG: IMP dehydrogenase, partial [Dehalococcoidia bacterium]
MKDIPLALTYDDVLLLPRFSSIRSRREVDCSAQFTRQIQVQAPLVSANMDTVTESRMAIALAEFGGIGVIHRFLTIEQEVAEVSRVKRFQSEVIEDPYTIKPRASIGQARRLMEQLGIGGLPVVTKDRQLVGILTRRDLQLVGDSQPVSERMTPRHRLVVAPQDIDLEQARHGDRGGALDQARERLYTLGH